MEKTKIREKLKDSLVLLELTAYEGHKKPEHIEGFKFAVIKLLGRDEAEKVFLEAINEAERLIED